MNGISHRVRACLATIWLTTAACSGGSGGGGGSESPARVPASGAGVVDVTVDDLFGGPVSGALVSVVMYTGYSPRQGIPSTFTDATGKAQLRGIPAGEFALDVQATDSHGSTNRYGYSKGVVARDQATKVNVILHPSSRNAGGVVRAWVPEGGLSSDARSLEFSLQLSDVPGRTQVYAHYSNWADEDDDPWHGIQVVNCQPSSANDSVEHHPDCVVGPDGFDASYAGAPGSAPLDIVRQPEATPHWSPLGDPLIVPFRTILLVEQSGAVATDDTGDQRLLAAKYFLNYASDGSFSAMLAAFAASDAGALGPALLPQAPVTGFPVENPVFSSDGRSYFPLIDQLSAMEGGAAPLFAAIDRAIDLQVAAGGTVPRSVVVITGGAHDETCGTRAACEAARRAVIQKSRDTGVAIVVVGYAASNGMVGYDDPNPPDWLTLGLLGQGAPGSAAFWAGHPSALGPTLRTVRKYLGQLKKTATVRFRIESPTPGAFASGRTVLGWVSYGSGCAFDCGFEPPGTGIPFAVTIP